MSSITKKSSDIRELNKSINDPLFLEKCDNPVFHAEIIWTCIELLQKANLSESVKLLNIISILNVENPKLNILTPVQLLHRQLNLAIRSKNRDLFSISILDSLNENPQANELLRRIHQIRIDKGIVTPFSIHSFIKTLYLHKNHTLPRYWDSEMVKSIFNWCNQTTFSEIEKIYPTDGTYMATGINRISKSSFLALKQFINPSSTYIEIGASMGVQAVEIKEKLNCKNLITTDIVGKDQLDNVTIIRDYKTGVRIILDTNSRKNIINKIDKQFINHDIILTPLRKLITRDPNQYIFGLHNLLIHIVKKKKAILNTVDGLIKPGDILWISGGFSSNPPLLYSMAFQQTVSGFKALTIETNAGVQISSKNQLIEINKGLKYKLLNKEFLC